MSFNDIERKKTVKSDMQSKFEATLLGALVGDCIGRNFEGTWAPDLDELIERILLMKNGSNEKIMNMQRFTDDTALTNAICESFIKNNGDLEIFHMIESFIKTFNNEPGRGYADGAIDLFQTLSTFNQSELVDKCFYPSFELFNGEGSYGNGGAMRCAPIPLITHSKSLDEMNMIAKLVTVLTHSNKKGIVGTLLQCFAIKLALNSDLDDLDKYFPKVFEYVKEIEENLNTYDEDIIKDLEKSTKIYLLTEKTLENFKIYSKQKTKFYSNKNLVQDTDYSYTKLLVKIGSVIDNCRKGNTILLRNFYKDVCNCGVDALNSVPVALLSFMIASDIRCSKEVDEKLKCSNSFEKFSAVERIILYSMTFGGDTDTIATMTGAIAGAFYGMNQLPEYLYKICESHSKTQDYAIKLFQITHSS